MESAQVIYIQQVFRLDTKDIAKSLGVSPITVTRWKRGSNKPTGLQAEVLQALYNVALILEATKNQQRKEMVRGLVILGIGSLIFYGISGILDY